jgi:hypothetical protein
MEEATVKAIEEFMRSPRDKKKNPLELLAMSAPSTSPILSTSKHSSLSAKNRMSSQNVAQSNYKKTGVSISKCYEMLCGRCGKRFSSKLACLLIFLNRNYGFGDYF